MFKPAKPCFYIDLRWLETDKKTNNFPTPVKVFYTGAGLSEQLHLWRINESMSVGIGGALMHIRSESVSLRSPRRQIGDKKIFQGAITIPRVTVKPITFFTEILTKPTEQARLEAGRAAADYATAARIRGITAEDVRQAILDADRVEQLNKIWGGAENSSRKRKALYRLASVPKLYLSGNIMIGRLQASDLGVPQDLSNYRSNFEYIVSRGVYFDLAELLPKWYK
jgi:hypothetical protein